eukprot:597403-Prymnesium_polylepis.1
MTTTHLLHTQASAREATGGNGGGAGRGGGGEAEGEASMAQGGRSGSRDCVLMHLYGCLAVTYMHAC